MYTHILLTTDGSDLALRAAQHGLTLAKTVGARTTILTVTPTWPDIALSEIAVGRLEADYQKRIEAYAETCLGKVKEAATAMGVPCEGVHRTASRAFEAIIATAGERGADLIVVGSHGRRGVSALLLGSEATRVLIQSKVPVLVYRE